jgi:precorrin-6B methylase 2
MIQFREEDLYPLLDFDAYTYQEAKDHALLVDDFLGFECELAEASIRHGTKNASEAQQNWEHLSVQAMQTPYVEIRGILNLLNPRAGESLVDLGAAYGRMGLVMAKHFPDTEFFGFEIEVARVQEAQRVMKLHNIDYSKMIAADLCGENFNLPLADYYFIFDYGHERDVRRTLNDLKHIARSRAIQVVARGRLSRALIHEDHPWLHLVNEPRHFAHFSIYRS